MNGFPWFARGS